ncbi:MAG TPA: GTPase HflX [Chromatiales bacterium]|nr:GTPase HflX [Thiotrichales bacterium]HIP69375.1 GTPase HflX [Chromatiales bacterium]
MFERPKRGERAVLVHIDMPPTTSNGEHSVGDIEEFQELVASTGTESAALVCGTRRAPDPKYFIGTGKADEVADAVRESEADVVIFDHALSPAQERNLERLIQRRVLDRTGLILDIFAQRARSHEGKLQVELAQLKYLSARLVRGWTHLERQKGGIGLRGPGEKQLETDRRLLNERIKSIQRRLGKVVKQREQGRQSRKKAEVPTVSLVGYTNAGKSTLFNALTGADIYVADQLFATLDPTLRKVELPNQQSIVLVDTVGFIRQLPHDLVAAFRATLQETQEADLLLHIIDASDPKRDLYIDQVNAVLNEIGAKAPQILVYNKIDIEGQKPKMKLDSSTGQCRVWVSARTGSGLEFLKQAIADQIHSKLVHGWLKLPYSAGHLRAELFSHGAILNERQDNDGNWEFEIQMLQKHFEQLRSRHPEMEKFHTEQVAVRRQAS